MLCYVMLCNWFKIRKKIVCVILYIMSLLYILYCKDNQQSTINKQIWFVHNTYLLIFTG